MFNNIIYDNTAFGNGDDVFVDDDFDGNNIGSDVNVFNNDFSDLFSTCDDNVACVADINFIGNINEDPLFTDAAMEDVSLQTGSPAVDTGDNAICAPEDFFGTMRPQDGNEDGVANCDMGAIELLIASGSGGSGCSLAQTRGGFDDLTFLMLFSLLFFVRRSIRKNRV